MNAVPMQFNDESPTRIPPAERLELICRGLAEDKSQRRIAAELGVDEATIRRDLQKLKLDERALTAIRNGAPAEPYLRRARYQAAEVERLKRIAEELATQRHSKALANLLLGWLRARNIGPVYAEQLFEEILRPNWRIMDQKSAPRRNAAKTLAYCEQGPVPSDAPEQLAFFADALLTALPLIAPERIIRDRAINTALRAVQ